ncbi:hypothetical protein OH687_34505 [Burkholderia anthina]|nr:hypothetical protein OH687_34505 [Burkholderia anthina]
MIRKDVNVVLGRRPDDHPGLSDLGLQGLLADGMRCLLRAPFGMVPSHAPCRLAAVGYADHIGALALSFSTQRSMKARAFRFACLPSRCTT